MTGEAQGAAPVRAGMSAEQAAEAGQAMLASAKAQKEQIAQGFYAQRQAVLDQVARQQAAVPTPHELGAGVPPREAQAAPAQAAPPQTASFTQAEIEAALRALAAAAPAAAAPAAAPAAAAAGGGVSAGQLLIMGEIARTIRALVAVEVRSQLAAAGLAAAPPQKREKTAPQPQFFRHNQAATPSGY